MTPLPPRFAQLLDEPTEEYKRRHQHRDWWNGGVPPPRPRIGDYDAVREPLRVAVRSEYEAWLLIQSREDRQPFDIHTIEWEGD
jgi:hypothetical protein